MPRRGAGRALAGLALAGLALAGAGAGAGARALAGDVMEGSFPCKVRVKGRNRGDPECTRTVWTLPRAQARRLGLKRRTVFRSCPSRRARRRAKRGGAPLTAHNLPGGEDRVLSGFLEEGPTSVTVKQGGFLWSALTYDEAEDPTMGVVRTEDRTLLTAERGPLEAARRSRRGTQMMCRTGTDNKVVAGVHDIVLKAEDYRGGGKPPQDLSKPDVGGSFGGEVQRAASQCLGGGFTEVPVLYELDSEYVESRMFRGDVDAAKNYATNLGNLASQQYELQMGVTMPPSVFVDQRSNPTGVFYSTNDPELFVDLHLERWASDPDLNALAGNDGRYAHVHLISGKRIPGGTLGIAYVSSSCTGLGAAISWASLLESEGVTCQTALIMHENGHTLSLDHNGDAGSVMFPSLTCSQTFRPSSVSSVKGFLSFALNDRRNTGCRCAGQGVAESPVPEPPVVAPVPESEVPAPEVPTQEAPSPPPESLVPCAVSGRKKKKQCNQKPAGKCIFAGRGLCLPTPKNGGKCTDLPRKKPCVRTGGCTWSGRKKSGTCRAR